MRLHHGAGPLRRVESLVMWNWHLLYIVSVAPYLGMKYVLINQRCLLTVSNRLWTIGALRGV